MNVTGDTPELSFETAGFDDFLLQGIEPSSALCQEIATASEERLLLLIDAVKEIDELVSEYEYQMGEDKCRTSPFFPRIECAKPVGDGRFLIPVADRSSIIKFLQSDDVDATLDDHYSNLGEEDLAFTPLDTETSSVMTQLPQPIVPMSRDNLFTLTGAYFWYDDKYLSPADTLHDIARDAPPELLVPLILRIEANFPKYVDDDGCYKPIVWHSGGQYVVEGDVIWQLFTERDLRHDLEFACEATDTYSWAGRFHGIEGEELDEEYICKLMGLTAVVVGDEEADKVSEQFSDVQNERWNSRFRLPVAALS